MIAGPRWSPQALPQHADRCCSCRSISPRVQPEDRPTLDHRRLPAGPHQGQGARFLDLPLLRRPQGRTRIHEERAAAALLVSAGASPPSPAWAMSMPSIRPPTGPDQPQGPDRWCSAASARAARSSALSTIPGDGASTPAKRLRHLLGPAASLPGPEQKARTAQDHLRADRQTYQQGEEIRLGLRVLDARFFRNFPLRSPSK